MPATASQPWAPNRRLDEWGALGGRRHLLSLGAIVLVALIRWHHCLLATEPLIDEETYLAAFRAISEGRSPYEVGSYHYTPFFAWVGGALVAALGASGTLFVLRAASLSGLALAVWCSLAWLDASWLKRLAGAVTFVVLAPAVGAGLCTGNVSFAAIGLILLALICWARGSILAGAVPSGLALGATVAAKPLAPLALVALFCHRPLQSELEKRKLAAGAAGGLAALLLLLPLIPRLGEMAGQPIHPLTYARSFSLSRILALLGFDASPAAVVVAGAVLVAVLVRLRPLSRSQLVAVAVAASILVTPIIWNHTLILTLPLQVMALSLAWERRRYGDRPKRIGSYELVLVVLGALVLQLSEGFGAVDLLSRPAQAALLALPYLSPAALLAYVLRFGNGPDPSQRLS